ncbi:NERD domain-containing protein [Paenalkalicoccus suaedae]|uniref:NERD domain-containing protein n=1 Tax=Paenalkalicoccus suaedae TaxID=2592382 RepID=A0A859FK05_9BACI|nr:NERD domain-containing protein [Paenalkalicoccus suaedae]
MDFHLQLLNHEELVIIHDIRLPFMDSFFQIDTLIIGRTFMVVIEAKNYSGSIVVSPKSQQLVRTYKQTDQTFNDPLEQAKAAMRKLRKWLFKHDCNAVGNLLSYEQVVFTNEKTSFYVDTEINLLADKYCRPNALIDKIEQLQVDKSTKAIPFSEVIRTSKLIASSHQPWFPKYTKLEHHISDLRKGVVCVTCKVGTMSYTPISCKWFCPKCKAISKDAHLLTLYHYALLINETISNKQFRRFFNMESRSSAYWILKSLNLPTLGSHRGLVYSLKPFLIGRFPFTDSF